MRFRNKLLCGAVLVLALIAGRFSGASTSKENSPVNSSAVVSTVLQNKIVFDGLVSREQASLGPTRVSTKALKPEKWRRLLDEDQLCEFIHLKEKPNEIQIRSALVQNDPELKKLELEILSGDHPEIRDHHSTLMQDFYRALRLAHLIDGTRDSLPPLRLDLANEILLELQNRDSENGVYAYYRAAIYHDLHPGDDEAVRTILISAFAAQSFDAFVPTLFRRLYKQELRNAVYYHAGISVNASHPVPAGKKPREVLIENIGKGDIYFDEQAIHFAEKLLEPAQHARFILDEQEWDFMMYANALAMGKGIWVKLHPDLEVPYDFVGVHHPIAVSNMFDGNENSWEALDQVPCDRHGFDLLYALTLRNSRK